MSEDYTVDTVDVPAGLAYEYRARVELDADPSGTESPRDYDGNAARMIINSRMYIVPDEDDTGMIAEAYDRLGEWAHVATYLAVAHDAVAVVLSATDDRMGLSVSAWSRTDRSTGSGNGVAYCRRSWARENLRAPVVSMVKGVASETLDEVIEQAIRAEVEQYSAYMQGEVYVWIAERRPVDSSEEWEQLDACGGYIGDDRQFAMDQAVRACESARKDDDAAEVARLAQVADDDAEVAELRLAELMGGVL